jgi:hypothetical protein
VSDSGSISSNIEWMQASFKVYLLLQLEVNQVYSFKLD